MRKQQYNFKFDCFKIRQPRWLWIHKEEREFHGSNDIRSYSIPIAPICVDDYAEVSITLFSLMGVLKLPPLEWKPL